MILKRYLEELCRAAIAPQIEAFRNECFRDNEFIPCAATGLLINRAMCHIDHDNPSFIEVMLGFLRQFPIVLKQAVNGDIEWLTEWQEFHKQVAKLRPVYSHYNLSRPKEEGNYTREQWSLLLKKYNISVMVSSDIEKEAEFLKRHRIAYHPHKDDTYWRDELVIAILSDRR